MNAVPHPDTAKPASVSLHTAAAAEAALRTFWRLAEAWKLTTAEQITLLGVAGTTLYQWRQGKVGPLDQHVLERLSYLFGIYGTLQILLPVPERAKEWIRKPNTASFLGGSSALQRMMGGQVADLFVVCQYLDAERRGEAVARLMPPQVSDALGQARSLAARIRKNRQGRDLGDGVTIRDLIDESRR